MRQARLGPSADLFRRVIARLSQPRRPVIYGVAGMRLAKRRPGIEVPLNGWPVPAARALADDPPRLVLLRVSAQRYDEPADFDALAAALRRRLDVRS